MNFINTGLDEITTEYIEKSINLSRGRAGKVAKKIVVHPKNGSPYEATRYVNPDGSIKTLTESEISKHKKNVSKYHSILETQGLKNERKSTQVLDRFKKELTRRIFNRNTAGNQKIIGFKKECFEKFSKRGYSIEDIEDALFNPTKIVDGTSSSEFGSTEYWGKNWIVIVQNSDKEHKTGELMTAYIIEKGKINKWIDTNNS